MIPAECPDTERAVQKKLDMLIEEWEKALAMYRS